MTFSSTQVTQALRRAGFNRNATAQDIANAQHGGLNIFGAQRQRMQGPQGPTISAGAPTGYPQQFAQQIAGALPSQQAIPSFEKSGLYDPTAADQQYNAEFQPYYQNQFNALDAQRQAAQQSLQRSLGYVTGATGLQTQSAQQQADTQAKMLEMERRKGLLAQSSTAGQLGQSGSGVDQRDTGMINQGINTEQQQVQNILQQQQAQAKQYQDYATGAYNQDFNNQYGSQYSPYAQQRQNLSDQQTVGRQNYQGQLRGEAYNRYLQRYQSQPSY